jgi:predicted nucleotidyltransferase
MNRRELIERLKNIETSIRATGVDALYLYGSYARDEAGPDSDIDIMVEFAAEHGEGLSEFMRPYFVLEEQFPGIEIGYGTKESLEPVYRASVERDAVRIF